jgi:UDP-2,3-diacylglucosamine pyrophosphatase LpxH
MTLTSGPMKTKEDFVRVIIPDSHGSEADPNAMAAFLGDLPKHDPDEIIMLGDHMDVSYPFNEHQPSYLDEKKYDYEGDVGACNRFLDDIQSLAPKANILFLEGNHELHVERYAVRFLGGKLAAKFLTDNGPEGMLHLKDRGIKYFRCSEFYDGLTIRGAIRRGNVCFTHGFTTCKFAAEKHLARYNYNVFHGHTHHAQTYQARTVRDDNLIAGSYGCLSKQQPLWLHGNPSNWVHGYGIHYVNKSGLFQNVSVSIVKGQSCWSHG